MLPIIASLLAAGLAAPAPAADVLHREQAIAAAFEARFHVAGLPFAAKPPAVEINTTPALSYFDGAAVHEARYAELPDPFKAIFVGWAGATGDQPSGDALFADMFYRFFFVHEMGHWAIAQVFDHRTDAGAHAAALNARNNHWQAELECNRISVAWWREHDPAYLARLVGDFRNIVASLPDPVPPGQDMRTYFAANYQKLGDDPKVYGWFLLQSVVLAYDEPPQSFQHVIDGLATQDFS
jgi:hypothetical protein